MASSIELVAICLLLAHCGSVFGQQIVQVDTKYKGRVFEGIGAISGGGATSKLLVNYPPKLRDEILDYLFKPNFGASLQILKVEIGGDVQSTDGTEATHMRHNWEENYGRGYEWWLMVEAKKRNPDIKLYGLPWGFPSWLTKDWNNPYTQIDVLADYVVKWVNGAKVHYNLTIDFLGIWNEKMYDLDYVLTLRKTLDERGFENVRIIVSDNNWESVQDIINYEDFRDVVHAIGAHYPGTWSSYDSYKTGKTLWASEDFSSFNDNVGGGCWARIINENYVNGRFSATIAWNLIASYFEGLPYFRDGLMTAIEPWSGHYVVESPIWVTAHTTQFTEIGWRYLYHEHGVGKLGNGGTCVSFTSPDKKELTMVFETMQHEHSYCIRPFLPWFTVQPQDIVIHLNDTHFSNITEMDVWYTKLGYGNDNSTMFKKLAPLKFVNGRANLSLGVDEVVTLTTVKTGFHGTHPDPPVSKPFPLPYFEDFESYQIYQEPFNLAQQTGTFEVHSDGKNKFMRQMVTRHPIRWCDAETIGFATNYIGNASWTDIFVEFDFRCPAVNGTSGVYTSARVPLGGCSIQETKGVFFVMFCDGAWLIKLQTDPTKTKPDYFGNTTISGNEWHTLSLLVQGSTVMGAVDGNGAFNLTLDIPKAGFVTFGTYTYALGDFDNLHIAPVQDGLPIMKSYFNKKT
ncbi:hypothetical protein Btru_059869 [Bulinus truncatus]|nr:hypothetical protein Btru_059869 [Bulinus truncatus]